MNSLYSLFQLNESHLTGVKCYLPLAITKGESDSEGGDDVILYLSSCLSCHRRSKGHLTRLWRWDGEGGHVEHLCLTGNKKPNYLSSMFHCHSQGCGPCGAPISPLKMHATHISSPLTPELQKHQLFRLLPCWSVSTATRLFWGGKLAIILTIDVTVNASPNTGVKPQPIYPSGCHKTWRWLIWNHSDRPFVTWHHRGDTVQAVPVLTVGMLKLPN